MILKAWAFGPAWALAQPYRFAALARSLIDFMTSEKVTLVVYAAEVASVPVSVALIDQSGKILIEHSVTETAKDTLAFSFTVKILKIGTP